MFACSSRSKGFSLVELMVALVVGLVIILGAAQLYLVNSNNFRSAQDLSQTSADLFFFSDYLVSDLRRASLPIDFLIDQGEGKYAGVDLSFFGDGVQDGWCEGSDLVQKKRLVFHDDALFMKVACTGDDLPELNLSELDSSNLSGQGYVVLIKGLTSGEGYFSQRGEPYEIEVSLEYNSSAGVPRRFAFTAAVRSGIVALY